ncbi:MAG: ATP-dependent sacrificial sulfur transferase LarE [Myxococcaceae bacterium]|nr:ATP-dependent sacrificial sulfur transferase LarE [Myxococcaceae bacterium]
MSDAQALSDAQVETLCASSLHKYEKLRAIFAGLDSVLVAFSGGVDSAFVLAVAHQALGAKALALTAISASVSADEASDARVLAQKIGAEHVCVNSNELNDPRYAANPQNRCYFCKTELYTLCELEREKRGLRAVVDGFNADDKKDHRPGHQAALEHRVRSVLAEAGLTKNEVRAWSKRLGLPTWDKPQMACLASRLPYGVAVTAERLSQVERAEHALRGLGFKYFRVRHHHDVARLELGVDEHRLLGDNALRQAVDKAIKAVGYTFVAVDLEPFRSGRLNDTLKQKSLSLPVV